jgi:hypothetical protein
MSEKYSLETIFEKLRKIESNLNEIERRLTIRDIIVSTKSWDLHQFKKFMVVYLEEYKNEYVREFAENDIDVARGEIEKVLDILQFYSESELVLWAKPVLEIYLKEIEFYKILANQQQDSELRKFILNYLNEIESRIKEILPKILKLAEKDEA